MKIAAYCRVSTEKEAQIDSLEKQIEFFNEFTQKNGYELYKLYADEGISGKQIKNRKQFQQMMKDAKAKKFERVVVKDVHEFGDVSVNFDLEVKEGMIFSIEPGIYLPGKFGVRIEDLVMVTKDGCKVLNSYPKDLFVI